MNTLISRLPCTDGRILRSERTRRLLIESYLSLLCEDPKVPTANQIATRAGCSVRSVFERFSDFLTFSLAAADHAFVQGMAQALAYEGDADRQTRLRSEVVTRAQICERWLGLSRALRHNRYESKHLTLKIERRRDAIGERLELVYRPELSTLLEAERKQLLIALEAQTDFDSWLQLRQHHGLPFEAARDVWISAIDRILPPTPIGILTLGRSIRGNVSEQFGPTKTTDLQV
jgi:hypothetical protein